MTLSEKWKLIIVDDEKLVHTNLKLHLRSLTHSGKEIEIHHAYSASEAKDFFKKNPDVTVAILDVMMETDDAGLDFVRYIRDEVKNDDVRILLHTGQPGIAPKKEVSEKYVIDGYLDKNMVDLDDCYVSVKLALKSYEQLIKIKTSSSKNDVALLAEISDIYTDMIQNAQNFNTYEKVISILNEILHLSQEILASYAICDLKNDLTPGTTKTNRLTQQDYSTLVDIQPIKLVVANTPVDLFESELPLIYKMLQKAATKFSNITILPKKNKLQLKETLSLAIQK